MSNPNELGIGKIITELRGRDAIHIAVAPMEAAELLRPNAHVIIRAGKAEWCEPENMASAVGVVDPFLVDDVKAGERFWLFLYPGTVTSLRHVWTHPAFTKQPTKEPT